MTEQPSTKNGRNGRFPNTVVAIVSTLTDAFKVNPSLMVIAILNVIVIYMLFHTVSDAMRRHDARFLALLERCFPTSKVRDAGIQ
jgi:hypothetical protein